MSHRSPKHIAVVIMVTMVVLVATACVRLVETTLYDWDAAPKLSQHAVTRSGRNTYTVTPGPGRLRIDAPARQPDPGNDTRTVIWPPATRMTQDQQTCATWTDQTGAGAIQQGLALRVRIDGDRFRSIVIAKNVMYGAVWQMNVYTWDSGRDPYFQVHGAVQLRAPFVRDDRVLALPWRVCAKVEGTLVTIKGWRPPEPVPGWDSTTHAGRVRIPSTWVYPGKAGWYGGHIPAGGTMGMSRLRTSTWDWVSEG